MDALAGDVSAVENYKIGMGHKGTVVKTIGGRLDVALVVSVVT